MAAAPLQVAVKREVLYAGSGVDHLPPWLNGPNVTETRLDIEPLTQPDVIADMTQIPEGLGPFDLVYCCHALEHLYPYDVIPCLEGFRRVLKPGGIVVIVVPDLEGIPPTDEVIYKAVDGSPITGLDMYYGWNSGLMAGHPHMAHHCGFVQDVLRRVLIKAGFGRVSVSRGQDAAPYAHGLLALAYND